MANAKNDSLLFTGEEMALLDSCYCGLELDKYVESISKAKWDEIYGRSPPQGGYSLAQLIPQCDWDDFHNGKIYEENEEMPSTPPPKMW